MCGQNCVGIASDRRFGAQQQTIAFDMERVFKMNNRVLLGLSGLATDVATVHEELKMKTDLYKLREDRDIKPRTFDSLVSNYLYAKRFGPYFVEPLIAGLDGENFEPFISGQDLLGCPVSTNDFVVVGTADNSLYGTCETFFKPNLGPEELYEVMAQCLIQATDRDCLSGNGGVVFILTPDRLIVREIKGRHD